MNTRENERANPNQNINHQLFDGVDREASKVDGALAQAKTFVDETVESAKNTINSAKSDASSSISKAMDKTVSTVKDQIETGKKYLADQHLETVVDDFTDMIKKYPVQSLFVGIGVGIIIGNVLSRK